MTLEDRIWLYLIEMPPGKKVEIKTPEQLQIIQEFITLHGYDYHVELTHDKKHVKKHHYE